MVLHGIGIPGRRVGKRSGGPGIHKPQAWGYGFRLSATPRWRAKRASSAATLSCARRTLALSWARRRAAGLGRNDAELIGPVAQNEQIKMHHALIQFVIEPGAHDLVGKTGIELGR